MIDEAIDARDAARSRSTSRPATGAARATRTAGSSRLAWYQGDGARVEEAAATAVELLETLPPGRELALAYG